MSEYQSFDVIGFHGCDREVGLKLLNGKEEVMPSLNDWDWLGPGSYFWEGDPSRSLAYSTENSQGKQKNKTAAEIPFVLGAIIELGNCLNLVESESLKILAEAYERMNKMMTDNNLPLPVNTEANRALDCAVIRFIHKANKTEGKQPYDSIRCAFPEGKEAYPGAKITSRLHIQICICNADCIKGYFLPKPIEKYNPHLNQ
jgi:hypothetical protein